MPNYPNVSQFKHFIFSDHHAAKTYFITDFGAGRYGVAEELSQMGTPIEFQIPGLSPQLLGLFEDPVQGPTVVIHDREGHFHFVALYSNSERH